MVESTWKAKRLVSATDGSSCEVLEGSQGRERSDTLWASTSAMQRLTVLEAVEVPSTQRPMPRQKRAPAIQMEGEGEPSESRSSAKRQRERSPVRVPTVSEGLPEVEPSITDWAALAGDEDVEMGTTVEGSTQVLRGESPQGQMGAEARAYLRGRLTTMGAELKRLKQALFDKCEHSYGEKMQADAEHKQVEEERVRMSEVTRGIAHAVMCLQQTVTELAAEAREQ